jgi:hypothetical protein
MIWQRWFLIGATAYNAAWVALLLAAPERVLARVPSHPSLLAFLVAAEGVCLGTCGVHRVAWLLGLALAGKALGPPTLFLAVRLGMLRSSRWWLTLVNDVVWIPPLAWILAGGTSW